MDKKEKLASIRCLTMLRFIYGALRHGGTTNANDAFTILFGASTVQDGSASTCFLYCIPEISS